MSKFKRNTKESNHYTELDKLDANLRGSVRGDIDNESSDENPEGLDKSKKSEKSEFVKTNIFIIALVIVVVLILVSVYYVYSKLNDRIDEYHGVADDKEKEKKDEKARGSVTSNEIPFGRSNYSGTNSEV